MSEVPVQDRITLAYMTAFEAAQRAGTPLRRVEIHASQDVIDAIKGRVEEVAPTLPAWVQRSSLFGYPVFVETERGEGHLSVHTVEDIA